MHKNMDAVLARSLLDYDPVTGLLSWRPRSPQMFVSSDLRSAEWRCRNWNARHSGKIAGCVDPSGYQRIRINYRLYLGHRLAWLIVHGEWPDDELDHRIGVLAGDAIANLRPASRSQNMQNAVMSRRNKSGYIGVSWHKTAKKWIARIGHEGCSRYLGLFDDRDSAYAAYLAAKAKYHTFQPTPRVL